jgi:heat shock protein HslJ
MTPFLSLAKKKPHPRPISGSYRLAKLKDGSKMRIVKLPKSEVIIDSKQGNLKAYILCNSISGDFLVERNKIKALHVISTEMVCKDDLLGLHENFMKNLNRVNHYKTEKDFTYLLDGREVLIVLKRK